MNFTNFFRFLCVLVLQQIVSGAFSVNYQPHKNYENDLKMMNFGASFNDAPSAEQVADIYTRLSGKAPLLLEEQVNLPTVHSFRNSESVSSPLLVEIQGGVLPRTALSAIRVPTASEHAAPALSEVVATLKNNGIIADAKTIKGENAAEFLASQDRPVIILHNNGHLAMPAHRVLQSTETIPLDEFQISQYQICLWTGVGMVLLMLVAICSIVEMDVVPDNILFAKFQSGRTDGKRD